MPEQPFVAIVPIYVGTALGYNVGDEVPDDNVKVHGWEDMVERRGSGKDDESDDVSPPE